MPAATDMPTLLDPYRFPSTSWLASERAGIFRSVSAKSFNTPLMLGDLAGKRTVKFETPAFQPVLHHQYLSSEEDLSGSDQSSDGTMSNRTPLSRKQSARHTRTPSLSEIDEHVARTITFIAPGKPRLIDVNTFGPIDELRPALRKTSVSKMMEPSTRRRIQEGRELDRIIRSRSLRSQGLGYEDPYWARKPLLAPLGSSEGRTAPDGDATRSKHSPKPSAAQEGDSPLVPYCPPSKAAAAHSVLRGVAHTLMSAKRKAGLSEASCLAPL